MKRPDLEAMHKRLCMASPAPWCDHDSPRGGIHKGQVTQGGETIATVWCGAETGHGRHNARFIAHAREDMPDLLAYVEHLEKKNRGLLAWANSHPHNWQCQVYEGDICTCGWEKLVENEP